MSIRQRASVIPPMIPPNIQGGKGAGARPGALVALLCLGLGLAGCEQPSLDETQVIARVNGDDISIHQLNYAKSRSPVKVLSDADRDALVEKMIDRQLAAQKALAMELDRKPEVMMRLEEARLDVLAAAYADTVTAGDPASPTRSDELLDQEATDFFAAHPALFSERKLFRVREVSIPIDSPALDEAQARLQRKEDLEDVLAWLGKQPGSFTDQRTLRPAEQLPIEVADRLNQVKPGQTIAFRLPRTLMIYRLEAAEPAPLDWAAAKPIIRDYLKKQHDTEGLKRDLVRLRETATIARKSAPQ